MLCGAAVLGFGLASPAAAQHEADAASARADSLLAAHDYFALRDLVFGAEGAPAAALPPAKGAFVRGVVRNKFLDTRGSTGELRRFLAMGGGPAADRQTAYELLADNAMKEERYADAAAAYGEAAEQARTLAPTDTALAPDLHNSARLWGTLAGVGPQQVVGTLPVSLAGRRDAVGLLNVPVAFGDGAAVDAIFDTGANVTTLVRSLADAVGVRYRPDSVLVGGITGTRTWARVGVVPRLRVGSAAVTNVAVLVFPDSALTIPQIHFVIRAVLGFPVLRAFGGVTWARGDTVVFGHPGPGDPERVATGNVAALRRADVAVDELKLLVSAGFAGRRGSYQLDTGATATQLYGSFAAAYPAAMAGARADSLTLGGAGGVERSHVRTVGPVDLTLGGGRALLPTVPVMSVETGSGEYLFGNLGQDVLRQFSRVTIDFDRLRIRVE